MSPGPDEVSTGGHGVEEVSPAELGEPSLVARCTETLATDIVTGRLAVDERTTLTALAERLQVSKATARDAAHRLAARGLLEIRARASIVVQPMERWQVFDPEVIRWRSTASRLSYDLQIGALSELRLAVEPTAAELAAQRSTRRQDVELMQLLTQLKRLGLRAKGVDFDAEAWNEVDKRFHQLLLHSTHNEMFVAHAPTISAALTERLSRMAALDSLEQRQESGPEGIEDFPAEGPKAIAVHLHLACGRAVLQRKPEAAAIFMRGILAEFRGEFTPGLRLYHDLAWAYRQVVHGYQEEEVAERRGLAEELARRGVDVAPT